MEKKYIIIILLILTVGFASVNTVIDLNGKVDIGFKYDDFNIIISKIIIDGENVSNIINEDKQSFTYTGTGINNIEYTIKNKSYQYDANINLICEPNEGIKVQQVGKVEAQSKKSETIESNTTSKITCRIDIEKISKVEIAEPMCEYEEGFTWTYDYTGSEQEFNVPCDGEYKFELWGANSFRQAYAGYTSGKINLSENLSFFIYVGQYGDTNLGGYNGGGSGRHLSTLNYFYGGGATDIRLKNGAWNNFESLKSRIMVAAGSSSVSAGGLQGYNYTETSQYSYGGTQTSGGTVINYTSCGKYNGTAGGFGYGGIGGSADTYTTSGGINTGGIGGGSGYFGGGGSSKLCAGFFGAGAGSSFISGHNGCDAIAENSTQANIIHTGQPNHYSGYVFTDTLMIDGLGYKWTNKKEGQIQMPKPDGSLYALGVGHTGDGYAKITLVSTE